MGTLLSEWANLHLELVELHKEARKTSLPGNLKLIGFDIETTMRGPDHAKASPHFNDNKLLSYAFYQHDHHVIDSDCYFDHTVHTFFEKGHMIVGHNLKFDLGFLRAKQQLTDKQLSSLKVWDTQLAQYLLSGQLDKFPSLEYTCKQWGIPYVKDPEVVAMIEAGKIEEVPSGRLLFYNVADTIATTLVACHQIKAANECGMLQLCLSQMNAMLAVMECECNGLKINPQHFIDMNDALQGAMDGALGALYSINLARFGTANVDMDWNSNKFVAALLYGGIVKEHYVETKTYKNGRTKEFNRTRDLRIEGYGFTCPEATPGGGQSVATETLEILLAQHPGNQTLELLLRYRELVKIYNTYSSNLAAFADSDWLIHHTLHQTATSTGRLSSSKPNLQNVPINKEFNVKQGFVSRFGDDGVIVEADYKQLEVLGLQYVTGDPVLKSDLWDGRDIHTEVGKEVYGHAMSKEERRVVKTIDFGLIYGGGIPTLVKQSGQPTSLVKNIVESFYRRYKQVRLYNKDFNAAISGRIDDSVKFVNPETGNLKLVHYQSPTGRIYWFAESLTASKYGGRRVSYTQTCNYPVQGFATGDFVPAVLGRIFRSLMCKPEWAGKVLLINTVHDNIMFDVHREVLNEFLPWLRDLMEDGGNYINKVFGLEGNKAFDLPVKVEITYGPSWGEQQEWSE